jgi:hypothetical protein
LNLIKLTELLKNYSSQPEFIRLLYFLIYQET